MFLLPTDLRVSDADREAAVEFLKRHYAAGRLTDRELSARVEAAYAARYASQLEDLTDDLPLLPPTDVARRSRNRRLGTLLAAAAVAPAGVMLASVVPAELYATLLAFGLPLLAMVLFTVAPLAVPMLAMLWFARAVARPYERQHHHRQWIDLREPAARANRDRR